MIDFYIGKPPSTNPREEKSPSTIQQEIRETLQIARRILQTNENLPKDRRKNTRDRRRERYDDIIVRLTSRREKRTRLDRRQKLEFLNSAGKEAKGQDK